MSETSNLKPAARRVQEGARALGLDITVREMPQSTRTAEEAAAACGCEVAQIVKSLVFRGKSTGRPYLLLVSGANRVNEKAVAGILGEPLVRPDAQYVREVTGYAIGGIPPLAHSSPLATYMDEHLLAFRVVWAAAGTPECVFAVQPGDLRDKTGARVIRVT
jgi:prolyl-tRNA editing enzyme YbaK/EbsC (Cys-tRNA(Pro) deacylase)